MLKSGAYIPTLMYLFKSYICGDLRDAKAHVGAYTLPAEAREKDNDKVPLLSAMVHSAMNLKHIPPIPILNYIQDKISTDDDYTYKPAAYKRAGKFSYFALLRPGETLHLQIDLRKSWADREVKARIKSYYYQLLRGPAKITKLNVEGSLLGIEIT